MKQLYIIAGCNGAGKTSASYAMLPQILNCKEFVNADEIARGLSPFQPETASIEAGRLMLARINKLLSQNENFAKRSGYTVTLLFLWLNAVELAIHRVKTRVLEGGHNIPEPVIRRRYKSEIGRAHV